jgi:hypothetical protein
VAAVRIASLSAVTTNTVGTELELPFGGYGLTGVCNDSAAIVEYAMRGNTSVYPLTSIGRYLTHSVRRAQKLKERLQRQPNMEKEIKAMDRIIGTFMNMPTDVHASPSHAIFSAERLIGSLPPGLPFQSMVESKEVMERIKLEHQAYKKASKVES